MIIDTLAQSHQYNAISPRLAAGFAFLKTVTEKTSIGRHEISGDDVYALVQQHSTKRVEERQYESHRKYIDIQFVVRGREVMYWAPVPLLKNITMQFDAEKDAALYSLIPEGVPVKVTAGQFTVFFPEDGHIPSCAWDAPADVLKVVVKVRV